MDMFSSKNSRLAASLAQLAVAAAFAFGLPAWAPAADQPATVTAWTAGVPSGSATLQTAVLSGGCFWGTQGVFEHVKGVHKVLAGYSGGDRSTADYERVSTGTTGHAESIQITFDTSAVSK